MDMNQWYAGPTLGSFADMLYPVISSILGILVFFLIVRQVGYLSTAANAWVKAKRNSNGYNMSVAEDQLLPPVEAIFGLLMLPAIVNIIFTVAA